MEGLTFLAGSICDDGLRAAVLGAAVPAQPAVLGGHGLAEAGGGAAVVLSVPAAREVSGLLIGASGEAGARLDFYHAVLGADPRDVTVATAAGPVAARAFVALAGRVGPGVAELGAWAERSGALAVAVAGDILALRGQRAPAEVAARLPQMLVRAAARLRAAEAYAAAPARRAVPADVEVVGLRQGYARFFAVEEYDLRFRRFDGTMSDTVAREVFISGDAASVLPYDPVRDRVLVIEQFRPGPLARGDAQPWLIEPIAGRVDAGETPEDAVRREALEEAGVALGRLVPVAGYYPSPAGKAEFLYSYIGLADLPDDWRATAWGQADEHEDIRAHRMSFDALMWLVETGAVRNGPLLISALFLARVRDGLRGAA